MTVQLPAMLADPAAGTQALWLTNARLFDGTDAPLSDGVGVLVEHGRVTRVGARGDGAPDYAVTVDLNGKTLMPGIINCHIHGRALMPEPAFGAEPILPGTESHILAAKLRESLRYGVTTVREMGSYGDQVMENRQAIRYGAFRGPRILTCGRILSGTAPGGRVFDGMYRDVDGPDEVRKGVREQVSRGADFIKIMATGARSVELEAGIYGGAAEGAPHMPTQLTGEEMAAARDEASRLGYAVAAHAESLDGCEAAIELGLRTIEHGIYLHRRPDLLEKMAEGDIALVPTFSSSYVLSGHDLQVGLDGDHQPYSTPELEAIALANLHESEKTLRAASAAGTPIVLGGDDSQLRRGGAWIEILRMIHHGLPAHQALVAATSAAAHAIGLDDIGTIAPGKRADLVVVDGNPIEDPETLGDPERIWLVIQNGTPVSGAMLDVASRIGGG